jgi:hypothetical protein
LQTDQLLRERSYPIVVIAAPSKVHPHVAALGPAQAGKRLSERRNERQTRHRVASQEHADPAHPAALLRARCEGPPRRDAEERDELAPNHSITSSAMASNVGGTFSPSAFATIRFSTSSNLVGCTTGKSAGFSPLRIQYTLAVWLSRCNSDDFS